MQRRRKLVLVMAATLVACAAWPPACRLAKSLSDRANRANADALVGALVQHRTSRGRYPQALTELVPGYVAEVAQQERYPGLMRRQFIYITDGLGAAFQLSYADAPVGFGQPEAVHILDSFGWRWTRASLD